MADGRLSLDSIDDYLGPGERRFFSRGYQRSSYRVHGLTVQPAVQPAADPSGPVVTGRVDVAYPADWSTKDGVDQRPHLSTIDALVLAVQLAELHLAAGQGLAPAQRSAAVLRKAVIRAGGAPQEDLAGIVLSARLLQRASPSSVHGAPSVHTASSVYDCTVGGFRVRCEIEHPTGEGEPAEVADHDGFEPVLGPAGNRFYGAGFTTRRHHIRAVDVDRAATTGHARVSFDGEPDTARSGVGGAAQPAVELVDAFVVSLQLAQVLMYELDGLSRGTSNTLWMMQTVLTAPADPVALPAPGTSLAATVRLANTRLLPLRGGTWRSVDIHSELAGITLRAAFAHELPTSTITGSSGAVSSGAVSSSAGVGGSPVAGSPVDGASPDPVPA